MKSGIKYFILKIEHSTRTLLVHSLITLFRLLFFSGTSQVVIHLWTCTTAKGWAKSNRELRQESLQCIVGPTGRRTASVPDRGVVASY